MSCLFKPSVTIPESSVTISGIRNLEKFFDRVNHDILIDRLHKRIGDAGVIRLIRAYLNSGIMSDGVCSSAIRARRKADP